MENTMSFWDGIKEVGNYINNAVGNNLENEEDDVRNIRKKLDKADTDKAFEMEWEEDGKTLGIITRGLDTQIKDFQKKNDLRVDGHINPGGETETALAQTLEKRKKVGDDSLPNKSQTESKPKTETERFANLFKRITEKEEAYEPIVQEVLNKEREEQNDDDKSTIREEKSKIYAKDLNSVEAFLKFLNKDNSTVTIHENEFEEKKTYKQAVEKNRIRFENSIILKENNKSSFYSQVLNMNDGEELRLNNPDVKKYSDKWEVIISSKKNRKKNGLDEFLTTGSIALKSFGIITAKRNKNII